MLENYLFREYFNFINYLLFERRNELILAFFTINNQDIKNYMKLYI